jgi:hypothetical protein
MKIIDRKTRKAIRKSLRRSLRTHGPVIAAGLVGGVASTLATLASTEAPGTGGKSNLSKFAEKVQGALSGRDDSKLYKHADTGTA